MKKKGNGPHPLFAAIVLLAFQILPGPMDSAAMGKHLQMDVTPENSTVLYRGDGQSVIQIRVVAPDDLPLAHRPPLNLALVLDRSGSMAGEGKMEHVRQAAHMLVDRLGPDDLLSIVTYNNRVQVAVPSRRVTDRQFFHRVISRIQPGDRTFLSGGLEEGYRQVRRRRRSGFISRVILLSDGLANVGVTDSGRLARMTGSMYESGVSVSTFGMGYDFDEDLLASMASGGGGSYYYISRPGDILAALTGELGSVSRTVATGVQIIIRPLGGCRFRSSPGRGWRMENGSAVIDLGDIGAGEWRTVLADMSVPTGSLGSVRVADVSVRYADPVTGLTSSDLKVPVDLDVVDDAGLHRDSVHPAVRDRRIVVESSVMMDEAARRVDAGDRSGALSIVKKLLGSLKASVPTAAVRQEMERAQEYSGQLSDLDNMQEDEIRDMQKSLKYRNYQELQQQ